MNWLNIKLWFIPKDFYIIFHVGEILCPETLIENNTFIESSWFLSYSNIKEDIPPRFLSYVYYIFKYTKVCYKEERLNFAYSKRQKKGRGDRIYKKTSNEQLLNN